MTINSLTKKLASFGVTLEQQKEYSNFSKRYLPVFIKPSYESAMAMSRNGRAYSVAHLYHLTNRNGEKIALGLDDITNEGGGTYGYSFNICPIEKANEVFKGEYCWSGYERKSLKRVSEQLIHLLKVKNFITD